MWNVKILKVCTEKSKLEKIQNSKILYFRLNLLYFVHMYFFNPYNYVALMQILFIKILIIIKL